MTPSTSATLGAIRIGMLRIYREGLQRANRVKGNGVEAEPTTSGRNTLSNATRPHHLMERIKYQALEPLFCKI